MGERLRFGIDTPESVQQSKTGKQALLFPDGEDLPLLSGTPVAVVDTPFVPEDRSMKQLLLPDMPPIDYDHVLAKDKELRRGRGKKLELPSADDIFVTDIDAASELQGVAPTVAPEPVPIPQAEPLAVTKPEPRRLPRRSEPLHPLREALAPYLDFPTLRRLAAQGDDLTQAYIGMGEMPAEIRAVLDTLALMLRPIKREQIKSPADIAAVFMLEMAHLDQEQLRVACLNTKNRLQKIHLVYQGSLNQSMVRVGEVYKEPLRINSAAIIVAHNHPSGEPEPSPEDILVTREIVQAGRLLDVECLDHLVIGQGKWVSMREKGIVWDSRV